MDSEPARLRHAIDEPWARLASPSGQERVGLVDAEVMAEPREFLLCMGLFGDSA